MASAHGYFCNVRNAYKRTFSSWMQDATDIRRCTLFTVQVSVSIFLLYDDTQDCILSFRCSCGPGSMLVKRAPPLARFKCECNDWTKTMITNRLIYDMRQRFAIKGGGGLHSNVGSMLISSVARWSRPITTEKRTNYSYSNKSI
jgi:hypothetical protein